MAVLLPGHGVHASWLCLQPGIQLWPQGIKSEVRYTIVRMSLNNKMFSHLITKIFLTMAQCFFHLIFNNKCFTPSAMFMIQIQNTTKKKLIPSFTFKENKFRNIKITGRWNNSLYNFLPVTWCTPENQMFLRQVKEYSPPIKSKRILCN